MNLSLLCSGGTAGTRYKSVLSSSNESILHRESVFLLQGREIKGRKNAAFGIHLEVFEGFSLI